MASSAELYRSIHRHEGQHHTASHSITRCQATPCAHACLRTGLRPMPLVTMPLVTIPAYEVASMPPSHQRWALRDISAGHCATSVQTSKACKRMCRTHSFTGQRTFHVCFARWAQFVFAVASGDKVFACRQRMPHRILPKLGCDGIWAPRYKPLVYLSHQRLLAELMQRERTHL